MTDTTTEIKTTDEDLLAKLDSAPSGPGNDWSPEPGDTVIGTVRRFEHPKTKTGDRFLPIVVLEVEATEGTTEELRVPVKHRVLASELLDSKVQLGDRVAIRYLGQPEGKSYYLYRVSTAAAGPRDESLRFTTEPLEDLVPEALAAEVEVVADQESLKW